MAKLYALFGESSDIDDVVERLNESDDVSRVKVFGGGAEHNDFVGAITAASTDPAAGFNRTSAGSMFAGTELEAEGLDEEIADYYRRNLENGAQVVVVETSDEDRVRSMLDEAGGMVSDGGK